MARSYRLTRPRFPTIVWVTTKELAQLRKLIECQRKSDGCIPGSIDLIATPVTLGSSVEQTVSAPSTSASAGSASD